MLKNIHNKIDECENCDLHNLKTNILSNDNKTYGKLLTNHKIENKNKTRILLVGICPSYKRFDRERRAFEEKKPRFNLQEIDNSGDFLWYTFRKSELLKYDIWVTNLVKCSTEGNSFPIDIQINACKNLFHNEINTIKPDYIIALGKIVKKYLDKFKLYHRIFSVYHPAFYFRFKTEAAVDKAISEFDRIYREIKKDKNILTGWIKS